MVDNTSEEGEEVLFEIIRSPRGPDDQNEEDDGSQYLKSTREGDYMIFERDDWIYEVMDNDYDYDGEENVDLEITETGEVYLYKQASGDHHMFFLFEDILTNRSFFFQPSGSSKSASTDSRTKRSPSKKVEGGCKVQHRFHQS